MILAAPAKLTVSLRVVGVRPDGYHELESEMVSVDLYDTLEVGDGDGLVIVDEGARPSGLGTGPDNIVRRALSALGRSAHVRLVKRIPVGGGLGGGSTDAAAVLRWAGCTDVALAASLGADVPFCLFGGRAMVCGIGEQVSPLPHEDRVFTLLVPPLGVDTAAAYRAWDRVGGSGLNELTDAAFSVEPRLTRWRDRFGEVTGREPVLAGSGSTLWVEGTCDAEAVVQDGEWAPLVPVRTVPAGWTP